MCITLAWDPTLRYWFGHLLLLTVIFIMLWVVASYYGASRWSMRKTHSILLLILVPFTVLVLVTQVQTWQLTTQATSLASVDCQSFAWKADLERARTAASVVLQNCTDMIASATGKTTEEAKPLATFNECPGFQDGMRMFRKEWSYLAHLETRQDCSGWCTLQPSVWLFEMASDSCSIIVARNMMGNLNFMVMQIMVYSIVVLICACLALLFCPSFIMT